MPRAYFTLDFADENDPARQLNLFQRWACSLNTARFSRLMSETKDRQITVMVEQHKHALPPGESVMQAAKNVENFDMACDFITDVLALYARGGIGSSDLAQTASHLACKEPVREPTDLCQAVTPSVTFRFYVGKGHDGDDEFHVQVRDSNVQALYTLTDDQIIAFQRMLDDTDERLKIDTEHPTRRSAIIFNWSKGESYEFTPRHHTQPVRYEPPFSQTRRHHEGPTRPTRHPAQVQTDSDEGYGDPEWEGPTGLLVFESTFDISDEEYREYDWKDSRPGRAHGVVVNNPVELRIIAHGGRELEHIVEDDQGCCHHLPPPGLHGCVITSKKRKDKPKDGETTKQRPTDPA